ncbi:uncharacterized protein LOC143464932 isoform X2 [Clavelina lepadiformis]|uniref:uncharacterized protein LOC143464932 isoform X2 n=1 Tax=Clavelina lepadiformis TaxID=159417 RepID=UPI0040413FC3
MMLFQDCIYKAYYLHLNLLAARALLVKQEPMDVPVAEKYAQSLLANINGRYLGHDNNVGFGVGSGGENFNFLDNFVSSLPRPPPELSPDSFANRIRHNASASMVVMRNNAAKSVGLSAGNGESPTGNNPRNVGLGSTAPSGSGASGLHQFVTRYTIERPDDPVRSGFEICLEGDENNPIIEVECGGNKGRLYVTKLCQGSKGQSILFNDEWMTPNEFQFISGRETAKDWKRSIRHCGKSLKTLMTKGILQMHPPVCECNYCKGHGPALAEKSSKKRPSIPSTPNERKNSSPDRMRPTSTTPVLAGIPESTSIALHKSGRDGGLNSIISQLHNKKTGSDVTSINGDEFLDLSVRVPSRNTSNFMNGRKRQRDASQRNEFNEGPELPLKRRHSNCDSDGKSIQRDDDKLTPLCLSSNSPEDGNDAQRNGSFFNEPKREGTKNNSEAFDLSRPNGNRPSRNYSNKNNSPSFGYSYPDLRGQRSGCGPDFNDYNEYALFKAIKHAIANPTAPCTDRACTPPRMENFSSSSHPGRGGFINLDSTSPRAASSRGYDVPSPRAASRDQFPMMELRSPFPKPDNSRGLDSYYDQRYGQRHGFNPFESPIGPNKSPLTVLHHHPNQYNNCNGPQSSRRYYPMPPPQSHGHGMDDRGYKTAGDSNKRFSVGAGMRQDRKNRLHRPISRKPPSFSDKRAIENADAAQKNHKMLDLQNHAIPMMSLTYSKKGARNSGKELTNGTQNKNGERKSESSPPSVSTNRRHTAFGYEEIGIKSDVMRRLSSSAPPPALSNSSHYNGKQGVVDENNNATKSSDEVLQNEAQGSVFDYAKPRAKSISPPHSPPLYDGGKRSNLPYDGIRPESCLSGYVDSPTENVTFAQQQIELLRWRELSSTIEDMGSWTTESVCDFLKDIGCEQYQEIFRENCIDGDALPLLMEGHLVEKMGLKLGHALKVIARVHRHLGNRCALVSDRLSLSRFSTPLHLGYLRHFSSSEADEKAGSVSPKTNSENRDEVLEQNPDDAQFNKEVEKTTGV